ncbi:DNA-directed RNA polymerase subunit RPC12/RpoP [Microvirga flocculans]|uniref:DNA-directed RNA polymerase subunit RPC12/RpoP n=1 Tax=Microvirga flocculans TaxID=217168 RepID=A0A7W6N6B1_9HYPH|nr:hypothetical protein [Microvirga flocculans]MBB4038758.1 DNA-directed RNA polymerase subunit RPC12/RpoP [Microvirga flocculans]
MPAEGARPACPFCGAAASRVVPVIHHMICAYVGPEYDFEREEKGYRCPKCRRPLRDEAQDWEAVGASAQCSRCHAEFLVKDALDHCV